MPLYVFFRPGENSGSLQTDTSESETNAMFLTPRMPTTKGEQRVLLVFLVVSGLVLLALAIYYLLNPRAIIGDSLVNTPTGQPNEFPPVGLLPLYVKPATILFVAAVAFSYCFFSLVQSQLRALPSSLLSFMAIVSVLVLAISAYEVLFNFTLWSSIMVSSPNPDLAVNAYPESAVKVNLVFATKAFVALFFVALFSLCSFRSSQDRGSI